MRKIYLDVCCWNRPFDDQTQTRIHLEAEAVLAIVAEIERGRWQLISSEVVDLEIDQNPDPQRRERIRHSLPRRVQVMLDDRTAARACELEAAGFLGMDALHLAAAEAARVDVFLTTDDQLLRRAKRSAKQLRIRVENPLTWLQTVLGQKR